MGNEKYTITIDGKIICENETKKGVVQKVTSYIFAENSFEYSSKKVFFDYYKDTMRAIISDGEYIKEMEIIQSKPKNEQKIKHFPEVFCFGGNEWHFSCDKWPGQGKSLNPKHEKFKPFVQKVKEIFPCIEITSEPIESKDSPTSTIPSYRIPVSEKTESNEGKGARNANFLAEIAKTWIDGNLCFCDDDVVRKEYVVNVLTGLFPKMESIFTNRYEKMCKHCFDNWLKTPEIWTQNGINVSRDNNGDFFKDALLPVSKEYSQSDWSSEVFDKYSNIGHDMPTWLYYRANADGIEYPMEGRPRVMIVSQDPLRKNHNGDKHLFLSTPWAFHSWNYIYTQEDKFSLMMELQIVHSYLNRGAIVYLTDYCKLYCSDNSKKQERVDILERFKQSKVHFNSAIKKEIKLFNPDFIVSLGNQTAIALTGYWNEQKDHRNMCVPLLDELCPDSQNKISVYVRYHTGAHPNHNPHYNDPEYWYVKQEPDGKQDGFIASNDISKQGDEQ